MSGKAQLINQQSGTVSIKAAVQINNNGGSPSLQNAGTISNDAGAGTTSLNLPVTIQATGTIVATVGQFNFSDLTNNGALTPTAAPANVIVSGAFTQGSTGTLNLKVGGTVSCTTADDIAVNGLATLAGTLSVTVANCLPSQKLTILSFGTRSGTFTTVRDAPFSPTPVYDDVNRVVQLQAG
jgi:hypothetical protein